MRYKKTLGDVLMKHLKKEYKYQLQEQDQNQKGASAKFPHSNFSTVNPVTTHKLKCSVIVLCYLVFYMIIMRAILCLPLQLKVSNPNCLSLNSFNYAK